MFNFCFQVECFFRSSLLLLCFVFCFVNVCRGRIPEQANCPLSELSKHITTKKTRVTDYAVATKKGKKAKKIFNQNFETMVQAHWDNLHEEIRHQLEEVGGNSGTKEEESIHRCVPVLL